MMTAWKKTKKNPNLDLFKEISHYNVEKVRTAKTKYMYEIKT